ncbi:energy-coupling factor transporter transmembrane component T family protein [Clostridium tyrobutyricum]|uniref:energy-coupling factor transporter transmembrane component T family protein n=1 Tax=Clostridium tyrobutyricum TaxID=1519 RepID=UPI001C38F067|nr:energy-coupling factor transporter transmembrane component T [Clostridium tyrobutyricum]MBV4427520.1 energy-coupling factor transporter transmembrane protein EcfT [Clostridium tyrobutyricum]MBV4442743.1 energy-coupling factor transporter transmembrane protein EcfT [Clostridium tyrobutyricum]
MEMAQKNNMKRTLLAVVPVKSPLYKFHPVTRLLLFIITGFLPLFIDLPELNLIFILLTVLLFIYSKVDLSAMKIYIPMMICAGVFTFLTYIFFPGKDPNYIVIGSLFGKTIYYQPIMRAFVSYSKIIALLLSSIFYFSTNRERDILASLRTLKVPFILSYILGLSLRSAGMFLEDLHTVREAEQARGLDYSTMTFSSKIKLYSMYIIPLLTLALRRSDEISNALFVKGYSIKTSTKRADYILTKYSYSASDIAASIFLIVLLAVIIIFKYKYNLFDSERSLLRFILK